MVSLVNWLKSLRQKLSHLSSGAFLCDTCKYDWGNACKRQERPNAKSCPEYKKR